MSASPVRAFLSYAHEDSAWRDRVLKQLGWLVNSGQLKAFDDRQIKPGEQWDPRIRAELEAASIIVVLISEHFVGSRYCTIEELVRAVERQRSGTADLVAIYCDWVDLEALPIASHQVLPQDEQSDLKPLSSWTDREASLPLSRIAAAVRRMVQDRRPAEAAPSPSTAPTGLPPLGRFVGRETDLDQLRAWLLDGQRQPIALLGSGGIGKSKLSIAALHDAAVAGRFGGRRLFVNLTDVRDEAGIHAAVLRELGREPGPQPFSALAIALGGIPSLVVLDNAETPWEADLPGAEQAFAHLAELPGVTLAASLRGYQLPGIADWRPIMIEPLPPDPARTLFLAIARARFDADPYLPTLLVRLDGLPLAIELIAHRAQIEPDLATLLRRWDAEKTAFVQHGQGVRKDLDLAVSIALSLESPRLTESGRRLFALLGRLPHGLPRADLGAVMPIEGEAAASALHATGLVLRNPERLGLLAPIRDYAAEQPLPDRESAALAAHFAALADALPWAHQLPVNRVAAAGARAELSSIEAVLGVQDTGGDPTTLVRRASQWIGVGDTRQMLGSIALAETAYLHAHTANLALTVRDPGNVEWQRNLSVSWERLGNVRDAQGDLTGALQAYTESKNIAEQLAATDPGNEQWQFNLGISNERIGDVLKAQRRLTQAAQVYQRRHEIIAKLAAADPGNTLWQRDLSVSWNKLGDVRNAQGDLQGALEAHTEGKNIANKLAIAGPGNALWQRDLFVSWIKLGDVRDAQCNQQDALQAYTKAKNIADNLASADPGNALRQRGLSHCWQKLGNLRRTQGDLEGALAAFTNSKNIADRLVASDPDNAQWQRDLIILPLKLAEIAAANTKRQDAVRHYAEALHVARELAASGRLAPADAWMVEDLQRRLATAKAAAATPEPPPIL